MRSGKPVRFSGSSKKYHGRVHRVETVDDSNAVMSDTHANTHTHTHTHTHTRVHEKHTHKIRVRRKYKHTNFLHSCI